MIVPSRIVKPGDEVSFGTDPKRYNIIAADELHGYEETQLSVTYVDPSDSDEKHHQIVLHLRRV